MRFLSVLPVKVHFYDLSFDLVTSPLLLLLVLFNLDRLNAAMMNIFLSVLLMVDN